MKVIRAGEEHLPIIANLFDEYRVFYEKPSDKEKASAFLSQRIERNESIIFLACDENETTGMGFVQLYPSFSSVGAGRIYVLNDLYVNPQYRRNGIARKLMVQAYSFAKENQALKLVLQTAISNTAAQKLYESLGYCKEQKFLSYNLVL